MNRFLNWLLGPRCALGCGTRVFPDDLDKHLHIEHAADLPQGVAPKPGDV